MTQEEVKTKLLQHAEEILNYLQVGIKEGADFAKEQVPLVIQEYLRWGMAEAILYMLICTLVSIFCFICANKFKKPWSKLDHPGPYLIYLVGGLVFIPFFINLFTLVQIWIAPRVYLIEEFTKLVRGQY